MRILASKIGIHAKVIMASMPYRCNRSNYMASITEKFGKNLKRIREKKGLRQEALAVKAKLDVTTINELEQGNRDPMLKTIWKIANALDVKMSQLFDF